MHLCCLLIICKYFNGHSMCSSSLYTETAKVARHFFKSEDIISVKKKEIKVKGYYFLSHYLYILKVFYGME